MIAVARAAALAAAAVSCAVPGPEPHVRILGAAPEGDAVPPGAAFEVTFSGPVDAAGIVDGRRIAIALADDLREALAAVESEEGAAPGGPAAPATLALADGGTRAEIRPEGTLAPSSPHVLVVSSQLRDALGRPVLDPGGARRPFVHLFTTGPLPGPPPFPVITEVRADAETPEAGGEYVEIANVGEGALDLRGHRLAKRTSAGGLSSCAVALVAGGPVPPGGHALVAGGAYDGRYDLPDGTARYACGTAALLGGIANDRPAEIVLVSPAGIAVSSLGAAGAAPLCATVERIDPRAADLASNLACAEGEGTPGECNSVTDFWDCP